mgnify:CR=1 FL=1
MRDVLMFILPGCPHCRYALEAQEELLRAHPEWRDIPLRIVDESQERAFADAHDYYYVPTWYVGGEKVFEGHAEPEDVERAKELLADLVKPEHVAPQ